MSSKQRKTLEAIFANPVSPSIAWQDIESLFKSQGGRIMEGRGSRVRFIMGEGKNAEVATFHRPHPQPSADKGAVKAVRRYFESIGIRP